MSQLLEDNGTVRWVQSCITSVGFPQTIEGVLKMVEKNRNRRNWKTDLDTLLEPNAGAGGYWTGPRWLTQDDVLFFYHIKTASRRVARLIAQVGQASTGNGTLESLLPGQRTQRRLLDLLERAALLADRYAGTIFGCAQVAGPAERLNDEGGFYHYRSRVFVPLGEVHIFDTPLHSASFVDLIKIKRQGTITPLDQNAFAGLVQRLAEHNELPDFLRVARFGELGFRNVNQANWPSISCAEHTRFLYEAQLRAYLLDFVLQGLKDPRTPLLKECRCLRQGQATGYADYFVKLHDVWVPVEAKLNVLSESNLLDQVSKYIHIDSFVPTTGSHKDERFQTDDSPICLVMDQSGIYITSEGTFQACTAGEPVWGREQLDHRLVPVIREHLRSFV